MGPYATAAQIYAGGLIFARLAALVMLIPGIGDTVVPARVRMAFAFLMTLMLLPVVAPVVPPVPGNVSDMAIAVIGQILIGLMIGGVLRMFMAALAVAGEVVSIQTTLSFAQTAAPGIAQNSTTLGTFLSLIGTVLIVTTDLHHLFLAGIVKSYALFPFGRPVPLADAGELAVRTMSDAFKMGIQLSAPVAVFALIFNVATGLVGRVMPQFQVFFVASPLIVLLGLSIFALSLGLVGMVWVNGYRDLLAVFGG